MASQAFAGFLSQLYVDIGGAVYTKIAEMKEVTLRIERDTIDVSSHGSQGWKDNITGLALWTATSNYLYIEGSASQEALYSALIDRTVLNFRHIPRGLEAIAGANYKYEGQGVVTSWEVSGPNNDAAASAIDVQGAGALVRSSLVSGDNP